MKKKTFNTLVLGGSLTAFLVVGLVAAFVLSAKVPVSSLSPERKAIHDFLTENLNDPSYEVVKDDYPILLANKGTVKLFRMKYRTKSAWGKHLNDDIFEISNGVASGSMFNKLDSSQVEQLFSRKIDPDDISNLLQYRSQDIEFFNNAFDAYVRKKAGDTSHEEMPTLFPDAKRTR